MVTELYMVFNCLVTSFFYPLIFQNQKVRQKVFTLVSQYSLEIKPKSKPTHSDSKKINMIYGADISAVQADPRRHIDVLRTSNVGCLFTGRLSISA